MTVFSNVTIETYVRGIKINKEIEVVKRHLSRLNEVEREDEDAQVRPPGWEMDMQQGQQGGAASSSLFASPFHPSSGAPVTTVAPELCDDVERSEGVDFHRRTAPYNPPPGSTADGAATVSASSTAPPRSAPVTLSG
eukprot:GHVU01008316.1.p2 GENE.GHVU01008316.1~~GHVU01008316.1.p2  ORF type:complete len:137 (+),score=34.43 GHVU01008316.1:221-631(+)